MIFKLEIKCRDQLCGLPQDEWKMFDTEWWIVRTELGVYEEDVVFSHPSLIVCEEKLRELRLNITEPFKEDLRCNRYPKLEAYFENA